MALAAPWDLNETYRGTLSEQPPDIIEFTLSDQYLGRMLYPRQATLLKVIFLQTELFNKYDYRVLSEWSREFRTPEADTWDPDKPFRYTGQWGIQPDILERIDINRAEGRKWFREVLAVLGRRGGKGYIGAICGAYVLWHFLCMSDPQAHYSIDRDKRLAALVFAGKKEQAKQNQWRDLINIILGAPCFQPYISQSLGESLTIHSKESLGKGERLKGRGIDTSMDLASFEIIPKEATTMAGRGPASFLLYFDEMAHVIATGANRSADELYTSSTPSLDQFGMDGFIYAGSSPWQMLGQFYELCQNALEIEFSTGEPVHPDKLLIQLTSWDIYKDWERADKILRVSPTEKSMIFIMDRGGKRARDFHYVIDDLGPEIPEAARFEIVRPKAFAPIERPVQEYNAQMRRLERANPETFAVERRSKWAAALDTYLNPVFIERMFEPWQGRKLQMGTKGILSRTYVAHGDPSKSGANFGWAVAHREGPDQNGFNHVVFDRISFWSPQQFEDGQIDYTAVEKDMLTDLVNFLPERVTMDQFNSVQIMQRLRAALAKRGIPKRVTIEERTATRPQNWITAETFKTALGMNLIHAPYLEQAELELRFLQVKGNVVDHPTVGPVQTKDVYDAMSNCVFSLIGDQLAAFIGEALSKVGIQGVDVNLSGTNQDPDHATINALRSFGRSGRAAQDGRIPRGRTGF